MSDKDHMVDMVIPISAFDSVESITTLTRAKGYFSSDHILQWNQIQFVHLINYNIQEGTSLSFYLGHQNGVYGQQIFVRKFPSLSSFLQGMPPIDSEVKKELLIKFS